FADAGKPGGTRHEADRNIGAEARADRRERSLVEAEVPKLVERAQCRRRIARAAANAGGDRQALEQSERCSRWPAGFGGEQLRRAPDEIVRVRARELRRLRSAYRQRQRRRRLGRDVIADIGEGDKAVEQVIAVRAPADDMEIEVELRRSEANGRHQPPRVTLLAGSLAMP